MRLKKHENRQRINGNLQIEFSPQEVTSYSGLEFFIQYFKLIGLHGRLRAAFRSHATASTYTFVDYVLCLIVVWLCGGRRLSDLNHLCNDPLVKRFCQLRQLPVDTSVSRWLKQFGVETLSALIQCNYDLVLDQLEGIGLKRVTLDVDGSVVCCGAQVEGAKRGYNNIRRNSRSYLPLLVHVAQTGHFYTLRIVRVIRMTQRVLCQLFAPVLSYFRTGCHNLN